MLAVTGRYDFRRQLRERRILAKLLDRVLERGERLLQVEVAPSGDSFVSGHIPIKVDIVDMEAYALAKVCKLENINFRCFKFISDNADKTASSDWIENCEKGAKLFKHKLKEITLL